MATKKVTLGGDRLGSENKMEVKLHGFNRSSHDIGTYFCTDQAAGPLVPCFMDIATNGTDYYFNLANKVRTLPTNGPLFGAFKHQIDIFRIPIRLYNAVLHNNALGIGLKMENVHFPMMELIAENDKKQVAQDSLLAYLGIRGIGTPNGGDRRLFQAMGLLAYWDIYKNYYANKQEEIGAVLGVKEMQLDGAIFGNLWRTYPRITENRYNGYIEVTPATAIEAVDYRTAFPTNAQNDEYLILAKQAKSIITLQCGPEEAKENGLDDVSIYIGNAYRTGGGGYTGEEAYPWEVKEMEWKTIGELKKEKYIQERPIGSAPIAIVYDVLKPIAIKNDTITLRKAEESFEIKTFELKNIDKMRDEILKAEETTPFLLNDSEAGKKTPYQETIGSLRNTKLKAKYTQAGLGLKTYLSDRFNNWLSTEWIDGENGINEITAVKVEDGVITMDALILQKKIYEMMNRIAVSGGSYNDWQEAVYGQKTIQLPESPIYEGGMSSEILFDEVVSTADATAQGQEVPLGSLAGRGSADGRTRGGKNIHVHIDEPSIIMIIESITPRVVYSQGNKWFNELRTMNDLHKPNLDGIGFQNLPTEEIVASDTRITGYNEVTKFSAGKQPSWLQYQTNVDQAYGDFSAGNPLDFMALNREYETEEDGRIKDLTTYIDPRKYNKAFAQTDLKAKNFWVQVKIDCTVRRVMSANQIPNL